MSAHKRKNVLAELANCEIAQGEKILHARGRGRGRQHPFLEQLAKKIPSIGVDPRVEIIGNGRHEPKSDQI